MATNTNPVPLEEMFDDLSTKQKMISMGRGLISKITERTKKGKGVDGDFTPYSTKGFEGGAPYWLRKKRGEFKRQADQFRPGSPKDVNLILTMDMINSFQVKLGGTSDSQVTIGFPAPQSHKAFAAQEAGRAISTKRDPVTNDEIKFIEEFWDDKIDKAFDASSGITEIIIGE